MILPLRKYIDVRPNTNNLPAQSWEKQAEKCLAYHQGIVGLNPNIATAIHVQESKRT